MKSQTLWNMLTTCSKCWRVAAAEAHCCGWKTRTAASIWSTIPAHQGNWTPHRLGRGSLELPEIRWERMTKEERRPTHACWEASCATESAGWGCTSSPCWSTKMMTTMMTTAAAPPVRRHLHGLWLAQPPPRLQQNKSELQDNKDDDNDDLGFRTQR